MGIRDVIFLLGLALMLISLFVPFVREDTGRWGRAVLFDFGLLLAIGAAHWPDGVR